VRAVTTSRRRSYRVGQRRDHGGVSEHGFTLVELAIALSLMMVVSVMATVALLSAKSASTSVAWRAEANSEIRQLIDQTFADLAAARPLAQCQIAALDGTCDKITESRLDANDPASTPNVLLSAAGDQVCYRSQRKDPVVAGDTSVTPLYWKVCLAVASTGALKLVATPPTSTSTYENVTFDTPSTRERVLGTVDTTSGGPYFSFSDLKGDPLTSADLGLGTDAQTLASVAKVQLQIRLSYFDHGRRSRTRALTYTAALRSSRYEQERWWSGDKAVTG
jgi:type II secretory pathway pseudopilin PulG